MTKSCISRYVCYFFNLMNICSKLLYFYPQSNSYTKKNNSENDFQSKRGSLLGNEEIDFWGDSPVFELDRWNFQQMLDLGFPETSQSLSSLKEPVNPLKNLSLHFLIGISFFKVPYFLE